MILGLSNADGVMTVGLWRLSSLDGRRPPWYRPLNSRLWLLRYASCWSPSCDCREDHACVMKLFLAASVQDLLFRTTVHHYCGRSVSKLSVVCSHCVLFIKDVKLRAVLVWSIRVVHELICVCGVRHSGIRQSYVTLASREQFSTSRQKIYSKPIIQ